MLNIRTKSGIYVYTCIITLYFYPGLFPALSLHRQIISGRFFGLTGIAFSIASELFKEAGPRIDLNLTTAEGYLTNNYKIDQDFVKLPVILPNRRNRFPEIKAGLSMIWTWILTAGNLTNNWKLAWILSSYRLLKLTKRITFSWITLLRPSNKRPQ